MGAGPEQRSLTGQRDETQEPDNTGSESPGSGPDHGGITAAMFARRSPPGAQTGRKSVVRPRSAGDQLHQIDAPLAQTVQATGPGRADAPDRHVQGGGDVGVGRRGIGGQEA